MDGFRRHPTDREFTVTSKTIITFVLTTIHFTSKTKISNFYNPIRTNKTVTTGNVTMDQIFPV
ncbi:unnamed protein product [Schistosoma margrebowiei]|uniref:Uncharacterized protein n=1 Tax=Schistosoma margrebowiei TaxID=48269 RepID=A0A3P8A3V2_9TREM|nr:unnamed protein product [Schistosoma margrebowiei]